MDIINRSTINYLLTAALVLIAFSHANAQQVDTTIFEGKQYFVYPFRVDVLSETEYYLAVKTEKLNRIGRYKFKDYQEYYFEEMGDQMSRKEYRKFMKMMRSYSRGSNRSGEKKYLNKKFIKAVRANPYPLLQQRFFENKDLTPVLDPIPDGNYIQFYSDFCVVNKMGECDNVDSLVAGYFSFNNNVLHGEATWIDLHGDTLKHGMFNNGLKEGMWKYETRRAPYTITKKIAENYIEFGTIHLDTTIEYYSYLKGIKNGEYRSFENSQYPIRLGHFKDGTRFGEWIYRDITYKLVKYKRVRIRNNELITSRFTYENDDSLVVHQKWIRSELASTYSADKKQFNFYTNYDVSMPLNDLYEINFEVEPDIELDDEMEYDSYDAYDYEMEGYYGYDGYEFGVSSYQARSYDANLEKYKNRGVLMDSLGGHPKYKGILERHYPNGELMYRYEFVDGLLLKEDTIFWDNGIAHDVITEVPDSNQFLRSIYDYDGKPYLEIVYDSIMDFVRIGKEYEIEKITVLDGFEAKEAGYGDYFYYNNFDTLESNLTAPLALYRSWFTGDSSLMYTTDYDPEMRVLSHSGIAAMGNTMYTDVRTFAEDFESWTGKRKTRLRNIELVQTSSGGIYEFLEPDSIPQTNVSNAFERFDVARDYKLLKDGENYTGDVTIHFGKNKFSISKQGLTVKLPKHKSLAKKLKKDLKKFREKGKTKYPLIMSLIDPADTGIDLGEHFYSSFLRGPLDGYFSAPYQDYYYELERTKKSKNAQLTKVEGFMIDGKAQGLWVSYDQFGKKMLELTYNNGEPHGKYVSYEYAFPKNNENLLYEYGYEDIFADSLPAKKAHYISNVKHFVNGKLEGTEINYNWYGEIQSQSEYVNGELDGKSIQRNKLAHSTMNYSDGLLDGYYQTYLTLPRLDSILLFDINFQDGLLQGESKSYHINGKLAKRGFFLDGEPIEDYEAYDSLGFKYHYVKFMYSYPIEEKIWEENELSVRYKFNWEDSIMFRPSDITTSQSLESTLFKLGLGGDYLAQPYYGRPSLVSKVGISYHLTKYYPNDTISRDGEMSKGRKSGCWKYYSYDGELLYEVDYQDSILTLNDSIKFKSKGILTDFDADGNLLHTSFVIEKFSKYDCAHTDHYEIRQLYTIWEANDSINRMNGYVQNFYDNGTLQSEGEMSDGLPSGFWKYYDPFGKLNHYGQYHQGKRDGRWLSGDLSKTKYLGDICLNPNLPDLAEEIKYRENLLDITITNYRIGKALNRQYYDIDMNRFLEEEEEILEENIKEDN